MKLRTLMYLSAKYPTNKAAMTKPIKKPPLAPNIVSNPPLAPANHGTPANPIAKYISILNPPQYLPRSIPANKTANVCTVIGTGVHGSGITIWAIKPVMHAIKNAITSLLAFEVSDRHLNSEYLFSK